MFVLYNEGVAVKSRSQLPYETERLAGVQHEIWSHWMRYMFSVCVQHTDGSYTIPSEEAKRWQYQMDTPYTELSEEEKQSDREQALRMISMLGKNSHD